MKDFVVDAEGPSGLFGVFEDDGDTGYLYLYDPNRRQIFQHLHIYDCSPKVEVAPEEVEVMWSREGRKFGVKIWGKMRGIVDVAENREGRVWLEDKESPGIADPEWLKGF